MMRNKIVFILFSLLICTPPLHAETDWLNDPQSKIAIAAFNSAYYEGLNPEPYRGKYLETLMAEGNAAAFNQAFEESLGLYLDHLANGPFSPLNKGMNWHIYQPQDVNAMRLSYNGDMQKLFTDWAPPHPQYQKLKSYLSALIQQQSKIGTMPPIPQGKTIHVFEQDARLPLIRARLGLDTHGLVYDETLKETIEAFQKQNGLEVDGVIGRNTISALNKTVQDKIEEVIIAMTRLRWLPRNLGDAHIFVNIPGFWLNVIEHNQNVLDMKVIVGRPSRTTPVFQSEMTNIVFNPPWYVPYRIAHHDIFPKLDDDPEYLANNGFYMSEIEGTTVLRQRPGKNNALGQYKFNMPNKFTVYLHDTNHRSLFAKDMRSLSSGCIRLEKPEALANYILTKQQEWNLSKIQNLVNSGRTTNHNLAHTLPVYTFYTTLWIDVQNQPHFYKDIYNKNNVIKTALGEIPLPKASTIFAAN